MSGDSQQRIAQRICVYAYRCQHQRTKKRDRAEEKAGARQLVCFSTARGATDIVHLFARATITRDIFIPDLTLCGLSYHAAITGKTHNILQSELALPRTGS